MAALISLVLPSRELWKDVEDIKGLTTREEKIKKLMKKDRRYAYGEFGDAKTGVERHEHWPDSAESPGSTVTLRWEERKVNEEFWGGLEAKVESWGDRPLGLPPPAARKIPPPRGPLPGVSQSRFPRLAWVGRVGAKARGHNASEQVREEVPVTQPNQWPQGTRAYAVLRRVWVAITAQPSGVRATSRAESPLVELSLIVNKSGRPLSTRRPTTWPGEPRQLELAWSVLCKGTDPLLRALRDRGVDREGILAVDPVQQMKLTDFGWHKDFDSCE
ncbi:hypothetical protein DV737_g3702, partial [Chaetothyriales sp. CBS 132003]